MMSRRLLLALSLAALASCSAKAGPVQGPVAAAEPERRVLVHGAIERAYLIAGGRRSVGPSPLVIVLHGGGTSQGARTLGWGFSERGLRDGVVTVHPDGQGEGWNDGRIAPYLTERQGGEVDDVGFILAIVDQLTREGMVDPDRVFLTGGSNGGMMTYRLLCEAPHRFAAAAPFIANMPAGQSDACAPGGPVPVLMINGDQDRLMPFDGGRVAPMARQDRGSVISSDETYQWWRRNNGCASVQTTLLPNLDPADGIRIREERAEDCREGSEANRLVVQGGGHRLPTPRAAPEGEGGPVARLAGAAGRDIEGADYIWAFFARHGLLEGTVP